MRDGTEELARAALDDLQRYFTAAVTATRQRLGPRGELSPEALEREQRAVHGLAWLATYVQGLEEVAFCSERWREDGAFGEAESLLTEICLSEYLEQCFSGIPMSQTEFARPSDFGLSPSEAFHFRTEAIAGLISRGNGADRRSRLVELLSEREGAHILDNHSDETLAQFRDEIRKFAESEVVPFAHDWHRKNEYIPLDLIERLGELGVFGITLPEEYGGLGLGKQAMCVVTEELSRAYIGVGSLGTRSEIAAELILNSGTEDQKQRFLPRIATGEILPTAVFTEPGAGSDLASLKTKAVRVGDKYKISGAKTWITHPVRADLMTILARTDANQAGHRGLSMFLASKERGDDAKPFPRGISGSEIQVLGYRGMKEYELVFEDFEVDANNLLGGVEGQGFKQLMQTFESARIQTAARAVGVASNAFELGFRYAKERVQFGKPLVRFPRVSDKLALMACEIHLARQLTLFAARAKDQGKRCDLEAGMAKLLGARVAWASSDNALQIHGGNGFALEYPISRVLCDARILNIFEGAAEIQAQVIARRLLESTN